MDFDEYEWSAQVERASAFRIFVVWTSGAVLSWAMVFGLVYLLI